MRKVGIRVDWLSLGFRAFGWWHGGVAAAEGPFGQRSHYRRSNLSGNRIQENGRVEELAERWWVELDCAIVNEVRPDDSGNAYYYRCCS